MKIYSTDKIASGNWLELSRIHWTDKNDVPRTWECVSRIRSQGAVLMIAHLIPSGRILLIRQFRPPVGAFTLEFPAGLIDDGETPEEAAIRELREETGYTGTVLRCSKRAYNSPGLTSEFIHLALMEVRENGQGELKTDFDETEDIETFAVKPEELPALIAKMEAAGDSADAKVVSFAEAFAFLNSEEAK